jgi:hypothetical protein
MSAEQMQFQIQQMDWDYQQVAAEAFLNSLLITELTAAAPAFFAAGQIGLEIETHWLGGRWMYEWFEIADIALFTTLRRQGRLEPRKVALLQTKRLYSREVPVTPLDRSDYIIGIGRLIDRPELPKPSTPNYGGGAWIGRSAEFGSAFRQYGLAHGRSLRPKTLRLANIGSPLLGHLPPKPRPKTRPN